jgi:hypothetical protein
MGYFDAITSAAFKQKEDGQKIFYPYTYLGRGYLIPSDAEYERLRRSYKNIWFITFGLLFLTIFVVSFGMASSSFLLTATVLIVFLIAFIIGYMIWWRVQCRGYQPTTEKLKYSEALSNETHHLSLRWLWSFEILSIIFILYGILLLFADSSQWLFSIIMIVFFSIIAIIYARMIRAKRKLSGKPG